MKIAICLSGFLRSCELGSASLQHFVQSKHDVDVFVHTYSDNYYEFSSKMNDELLTEADIRSRLKGLNIRECVVEDRKETFPLVKTKVDSLFQGTNPLFRNDYWSSENYKHDKATESSDSSDVKVQSKQPMTTRLAYRIYDQLRKVQACNTLRNQYESTHQIKYDLVIKSRFEVVFMHEPNFISCLKEAAQGVILTGSGVIAEWWIDDIVAISTPSMIDVYSNRVNDVDSYKIPTLCAHQTLIDSLALRGMKTRAGAVEYRLLRGPAQIHRSKFGVTPFDPEMEKLSKMLSAPSKKEEESKK